MARQSIQVNPSLREFEAYMDFSGGINTETSNERLLDNEFINMVNVDLSSRGSVKKRTGRTGFVSPITNNNAIQPIFVQGFFSFHKQNGTVDIIYAANGRLYKKIESPFTQLSAIPINNNAGNLDWTFQASRIVEATQFFNELYVATGSGLVVVKEDGQGSYTANAVVPYAVTSQDIVFIGTNALSNGVGIIDKISATPNRRVLGITMREADGSGNISVIRSGTVGVFHTIEAAVEKATNDEVRYRWEYKSSDSSTWFLLQDYGLPSQYSALNFYSNAPRTVDFKVTAKFTNLQHSPEYTYEFYGFEVYQTRNEENNYKPYTGINSCNRIRLHWGRLMLFGDTVETNQVYFSDFETPNYFPVTYTLRFDRGKPEPITTIVRIQDYLAVFSETMIHILSGKSPDDYAIYMINDSIGCVAPRSAVLTGNVVTFLSKEGVFILKPSSFKLDQMSVVRADAKIKSEMPKDVNACALNHDSQYWLCFPDKKVIYRYYFEQGVWVKDVSDGLDVVEFLKIGADVYEFQKNGHVVKQNNAVYADWSYQYDMIVETKYFDLSKSFNYKKLKKLYILGRCYDEYDVNLYVKVFADANVVLDPESGQAVIDQNDYVYWQTTLTPNFEFNEATMFGSGNFDAVLGGQYLSVEKARIRGKCRRVKLQFVCKQGNEVELFGFGLEFKLKKP